MTSDFLQGEIHSDQVDGAECLRLLREQHAQCNDLALDTRLDIDARRKLSDSADLLSTWISVLSQKAFADGTAEFLESTNKLKDGVAALKLESKKLDDAAALAKAASQIAAIIDDSLVIAAGLAKSAM